MPTLSIVQFETPQRLRRLGVVMGTEVLDVTDVEPGVQRVVDAYQRASAAGVTLIDCLTELAGRSAVRLGYAELLANRDLARGSVLRPPVDLADPYRVLITGTGLTHLGSMQSRDQMHAATQKATTTPEPPKTDSRKMFE